VTIFYVIWTKGLLSVTSKQSKIILNPVIGIEIKAIHIGKIYGPKRREMVIKLTLTNVGNAPAIELLVDAEIELRYSSIKDNKIIPSRFEPDVVSFLKTDQEIKNIYPIFGNLLITHFFDDVKESSRLNEHRIKTDPTKIPFWTSKIFIHVYYKNSLGQYFHSYLENEIYLDNEIPKDEEETNLKLFKYPRPMFHAGAIDEKKMKNDILKRNNIRYLSGW
jgi:hypothetical protein